MKYGKVDNPEAVDFTLPEDHPDTAIILDGNKSDGLIKVYVGCAKWNKQDLKNFYPRGTKDELSYYATQFNSIEMNSTFYNSPSKEQVITWREKTPDNFKFFPKVNQIISHYRRLKDVSTQVREYCDAISHFEEKLGMTFLQLHEYFKPKDFDLLSGFVKNYPKGIPLAVEVRNPGWFVNSEEVERYHQLLKAHNTTNVIVDTAGRRDMLHMRLTSDTAFVRYVGANHSTDYTRLDDWINRIKKWKEQGLRNLYFFVHQNIERESPLLSAYFIDKLNKTIGTDLKIPKTQNGTTLLGF